MQYELIGASKLLKKTLENELKNFKLSIQKVTIEVPTEYQECKIFWDYCQRVLKLGMLIYHIPNEGKRQGWYAKALNRIGLTPGILDYHYIQRNEKYLGLWLDMKRIDGLHKKKDEKQEECIEMLRQCGHYACYAYGAHDAIKILDDYRENRL
jgi:hypothetical protein